MGRSMEYAVYLPPQWTMQEQLPLVLFLHGGGDEVACFDRWSIGKRLDRAMANGTVPRAVIVVPQGEMGFWSNWHDGSRRYEDWVLDDLLPTLNQRYHTLPCPEGCHVMGISMGGYGALHFVLQREGLFSSVSALSAPVYDTEHMVRFSNSFWIRLLIPVRRIFGPADDPEQLRRDDIFQRWQRPEDLKGLRLFLARGSDDHGGICESNEAFHRHLLQQGIDHRYVVYKGGHKWRYWDTVIEEALRFALRHEGVVNDAKR